MHQRQVASQVQKKLDLLGKHDQSREKKARLKKEASQDKLSQPK